MRALAGLDAEAHWMNDGAWLGASDELDGAALWRSSGPVVCAFGRVAQWMNGALDPDASGELDGEARLRSAGAALALSGELAADPLLKNDEPWFCASVEESPLTNSGHGLVASVGLSLQMSGGPGIAASDLAYLRRSDGLGRDASGAACLQMNDGVSCPGGSGRCLLSTGPAGWGGLLVGVVAGVEMGLSGIDVGGSNPGEAVAVARGASCTEDGWRGDGWSLGAGAGVRTGGVAGEGLLSGLSAALAG